VGAIGSRRRDDLWPLYNPVLPGTVGLVIASRWNRRHRGTLARSADVRQSKVHEAVGHFLRSGVDGLRNDGHVISILYRRSRWVSLGGVWGRHGTVDHLLSFGSSVFSSGGR
jgi:hypothetical protein